MPRVKSNEKGKIETVFFYIIQSQKEILVIINMAILVIIKDRQMLKLLIISRKLEVLNIEFRTLR